MRRTTDELIEHLREKNRRYKLQLKQLQRAHFINKTLLRNLQHQHLLTIEQWEDYTSRLQTSLEELQFEKERLENTVWELQNSDQLQFPLTFSSMGNVADGH